jgi:hypothetical protein
MSLNGFLLVVAACAKERCPAGDRIREMHLFRGPSGLDVVLLKAVDG